jgi:hypothetical protein
MIFVPRGHVVPEDHGVLVRQVVLTEPAAVIDSPSATGWLFPNESNRTINVKAAL